MSGFKVGDQVALEGEVIQDNEINGTYTHLSFKHRHGICDAWLPTSILQHINQTSEPLAWTPKEQLDIFNQVKAERDAYKAQVEVLTNERMRLQKEVGTLRSDGSQRGTWNPDVELPKPDLAGLEDYNQGYYDGYHKAREVFLPIPGPGTATSDIFMQGYRRGITSIGDYAKTLNPSVFNKPDADTGQRIATVRFDGSSGSMSLEQLAEELKPKFRE